MIIPRRIDRDRCGDPLPGGMEIAQQVVGAVQAQVVVPILDGDVASEQQGVWFAP
jgi:hypothetical protein